jgi:hypothetical protein
MALSVESSNALWKLARLLFLFIPLLASTIAAVFALPLSLLEGWSYVDCFWTLMAEICGVKGIEIVAPLTPDGFLGKILGCQIGLVAVVILAAAAGTIAKALLKPLAIDVGLGVPAFDDVNVHEDDHTSLLTAPKGGATTEWICRMLVIRRELLRDYVPEVGLSKETMGQTLQSIGMQGLSPDDVGKVFARMDNDGDGLVTWAEIVRTCAEVAESHRHRAQVKAAFCKLAVLVLVLIPLVVCAVSAAFAGLLAWVEGWTYVTSFWLVLADLTHTNLPVVEHGLHVEDIGGKVIACFVGILALSVFVFAVGVVGGPLMEPVTEALGFKPMQKYRGARLARFVADQIVKAPPKVVAARTGRTTLHIGGIRGVDVEDVEASEQTLRAALARFGKVLAVTIRHREEVRDGTALVSWALATFANDAATETALAALPAGGGGPDGLVAKVVDVIQAGQSTGSMGSVSMAHQDKIDGLLGPAAGNLRQTARAKSMFKGAAAKLGVVRALGGVAGSQPGRQPESEPGSQPRPAADADGNAASPSPRACHALPQPGSVEAAAAAEGGAIPRTPPPLALLALAARAP